MARDAAGARTRHRSREGLGRRHGAAAGGAPHQWLVSAASRTCALPEVLLANSGAAGEWRICTNGHCRTLSDILEKPVGANVTVMRVCGP